MSTGAPVDPDPGALEAGADLDGLGHPGCRSRQGPSGEPGRDPVRAGVPIGDIAAGLYTVIGIWAALEERRRTGRGRVIDASMLDCQVALLSDQGEYHLIGGVVPGPQGSGHDSIPTYRTFAAGDAERVALCANTEGMWRRLRVALELAELAEDPRFATGQSRYANRSELWDLLEPALRRRPASEWAEILNACRRGEGRAGEGRRGRRKPSRLHRRRPALRRQCTPM